MENYPELKANKNVLELQEELTTTENQLAFARQYYNDLVTQYNTKQQVFPESDTPSLFKFQPSRIFGGRKRKRRCPKSICRCLDKRRYANR